MAICTAHYHPATLYLRPQPDCFFDGLTTLRRNWPECRFWLLWPGYVDRKRARIGNNVIDSPNVAIRGRAGFLPVPAIEDAVLTGAGACIIGPVTIRRGANIGANSVVLCDVPAGATAVGNPARITPGPDAAHKGPSR